MSSTFQALGLNQTWACPPEALGQWGQEGKQRTKSLPCHQADLGQGEARQRREPKAPGVPGRAWGLAHSHLHIVRQSQNTEPSFRLPTQISPRQGPPQHCLQQWLISQGQKRSRQKRITRLQDLKFTAEEDSAFWVPI